jgi:hypothetical protein
VLPRSRVSGASGKGSARRIASGRLVAGRPSGMCSSFCFGRRVLFSSLFARCQLTGRSDSAQEVAREAVKQFRMLNSQGSHYTMGKSTNDKAGTQFLTARADCESWLLRSTESNSLRHPICKRLRRANGAVEPRTGVRFF